MRTGIRDGKLTFQLKDIAIPSIMIYIIIAICFDGTKLSPVPLASFGIYLCAGVCGVCALLSKRLSLRPIYFYVLLFGLVLSLSTLYSPVKESLQKMYLYRFWTGVILMILVCNSITCRKDIEKLLHAVILGGVLLSVLIYAEYGIENIADAEERVLDELSDINMLGVYCAFAIIISAVYMFTRKRFKLLYLAAIVVMTPFLLFTGSRKAVLQVAVGLLTFLLYYSRNKKLLGRLVLIGAIIAAGVILINYVPAFSVINEHFGDMGNLLTGEGELDQGDINRMEYLELGWQYFLKKPFIGHGFFSSFYYFSAYTHCNYVELLMNNGILGFGIYYFMRLSILFKGFKYGSRNDVLSGLIIAFSIALLFCDIGVVTYYNRFLFIAIAICARGADILREEKRALCQEKP